MGKRGRKKKREGTFIPRTSSEHARLSALFWGAESAQELRKVIADEPALTNPDYHQALEDVAAGDSGFEPLIRTQVDVLRLVQADPEGAWALREEFGAELDRQSSEIEDLIREVDNLEPAAFLARTDELLPAVRATGMMLGVAGLYELRAKAFLRVSSEDRASAVENAIEELQIAIEYSPGDDTALERQMNLAMAITERLTYDRAENVEAGVDLMRNTSSLITDSTDPDLAATVHTNLAAALLRHEKGNRLDNLLEAEAACQAALQHRSPEREGDDWAYTQLNLAEVTRFIAVVDGRPMDEALSAYRQVVDKQDSVATKWLVGAAYFGLGQIENAMTELSAEQTADAYDSGVSDDELEDGFRQARVRALSHLEDASPLLSAAPDRVLFGRMLRELADVQHGLGQARDALETAREAADILRPTVAPDPAAEAWALLGGLLADTGEWAESATAYKNALEASELLFQSRLETRDRTREAGRAASVARWGAFSMALAEEPLAAALALDTGRARELHRRAGVSGTDVDSIPGLPPELRETFLATAAELRGSPLSFEQHAAGRAFQEAVLAIREWSGDESFGRGASPSDLQRACADGWPLLYVNPTPHGTLLLKVEATSDGPAATYQILNRPTAIDVFMYLMAGEASLQDDLDDADDIASFWAAVTGHSTPDELQAALDQTLPWLGTHVMRDATRLLREGDPPGVTLVACGPISALPLHACSWKVDGATTTMGDLLPVRYAPSGPMAAIAIRRAAEREGRVPTLVALANPDGSLDGAEPEVAEIAAHFDGRSQIAVQSEATSAFLRDHAADATHLHLACHASGSMMDLSESGVRLADGFLPATTLTELATLETRLVTVSACQTAIVEMRGGPEEVISVGTASIAAGSACAIASLWPVDDRAAALLLTRTYDLIFEHGCAPPEALNQAAAWLRALTSSDEDDFLTAHPALRAEFSRERTGKEAPLHRRGTGKGGGEFPHPDFWASFIAVGA